MDEYVDDPSNVKVVSDWPPDRKEWPVLDIDYGTKRKEPEMAQVGQVTVPVQVEWVDESPEEILRKLRMGAKGHAAAAFDNLEMALKHLDVYDSGRAKKYAALKQQLGEFADLMERQ